MPLVTPKPPDKPYKLSKFVLSLSLLALALIVFVVTIRGCNLPFLFSTPPQNTPEPTLTAKEKMKENAYLACAKYSYAPYYYPFTFDNQSIQAWNPKTSPLPKSAVTDLGDNWFKVDLHVDYTLATVKQSPVSGEDIVTYENYQDVWECKTHYNGIENGTEYWYVEILGRKAE